MSYLELSCFPDYKNDFYWNLNSPIFSFSLFRTLLLAIKLIFRVKLDCWVSLLKWMYMILTAFVNILLPPTTECSLIQNYVALLILVYRQVGIVTTYTEWSVFKKKFTVDNDKKPKQKKYTYIYIYIKWKRQSIVLLEIRLKWHQAIKLWTTPLAEAMCK